jgi:catechol 2,3-dioxygenase-like lactoylglutathione lyase family enzyme
MITRLSHTCIFVLNQERAKDFYVNKLGFKITMEADMGEQGKWITVSPPDQDLDITLIQTDNVIMFKEKEKAKKLTELVETSTFGFGVFECKDIYATYEELKAKGVEFFKEPSETHYGFEAMFKDDSGNWFSLTQHTNKQ